MRYKCNNIYIYIIYTYYISSAVLKMKKQTRMIKNRHDDL